MRRRARPITLLLLVALAVFPSAADGAPLAYLTGNGDKSDPVVALTWGVLVVSLIVIAVVALLLGGAIWHRKGIVPSEPGAHLAVAEPHGGLTWIWGGVGLTFLVLLGTVVWTMAVLAQVSAPSTKPPLTIEITGRQWWWQVRYLSSDPSRIFSTANEIHIPTGVPVRFRLIGADVIHSFWIPALSGKTDVIPGQVNETWMEARAPGTYRGQCTEYCGLQHAKMGIVLVAERPAAFRAWWDHQLQADSSPLNGQAALGEQAFLMHCGACHAVRGTDAAGVLGPDLSHLMTRGTIAAGALPNDPTDLAQWISDPQAVKPGNLMQKPELSGAELAEIRSYLSTLK